MKYKLIESSSTDPYFNLALEAYLYANAKQGESIFYLWQNANTVVIGRSQNPWVECNLEKMESDNVKLARRQTGGGAVYHDLGNLNFSIISPKDIYDKNKNLTMMTRALKTLGVDAHATGRNDMHVTINDDERKISGSAFHESKSHCLHHGTLLFNANLTKLVNYLTPHPLKLKAKGIKSVKSRVANLSEIVPGLDLDKLKQALYQQYQIDFGQAEVEKNIEDDFLLQEKLSLYKSWDWLYGKTLEFTHLFESMLPWGFVRVELIVNHGVIKDVAIYSDTLLTDIIDTIKASLINCIYQKQDVLSRIESLQQTAPSIINELKDFMNFMGDEFFA